MIKRIILLCLLLQIVMVKAQTQVTNLTTEGLTNPLGIDNLQPHFSWQLIAKQRNTMQLAYEIKVAESETGFNKDLLWTTGKVISDQSIHIPYNGKPLEAGKRYYWQVRIWDNKGKLTTWSNVAYWQMGLLKENDWQAQWISPGYEEENDRPSPLLRKEFKINKKVKSATAYITAHGLYEAQINGKKIGDKYFTPGWTSYKKRLQYQVYDVSDMFTNGNNAIGVMLGSGWYRGYFSLGNFKDIYGSDISLLFQLNITYTDGSTETIISDGSWKSSTGAVRSSNIYAGEVIDARLEKLGWATPEFNDKDWSGVKVQSFPKNILIGTYNESVTRHEKFIPKKIFTTPKGEQIIDFGQNLVGWVTLKVKGEAGQKITISHAEVLDKEGNFYTENLRIAKAQDVYILKGGKQEIFEPHFTWHGFRYVKLEGFSGELKPEDFEACALYSNMEKKGSFTTSNELINQLQHNIEWGLKGNFLDVPTDCPQRDERLGWTGDAQVFFRTASFLRGVNNFFVKWMKDLAADQFPDGSVTHVVPNVLADFERGSSGWGDAATIIPWNMYLAYGDKRILETQYQSMKNWVNYIQSQSKNNLWKQGRHFGDWLFYNVQDDLFGDSAITNKYLIAQCFYAHSVQLLINAAEVLGKTDDVKAYNLLLQEIKDAFLKEYTTANGATVSDTQTSYVLALHFDMLPEKLRQQAADRLAANIRRYDTHLTTGFLGTPYLCHVLSRFNYTDLAFELLLQKTYPSWLYPVTKDATTIWERWDGIKPDGSFENSDMNSFNHYAYGAIGDWMYRVVAGIDIEGDGIGYKKIRIHPHIGGDFNYVSADYKTPYGKLSSNWKINGNRLNLKTEIPPNTVAYINIPTSSLEGITESGKNLSAIKEIEIVEKKENIVIVKAGSGIYEFSIPYTVKK
ncbi:family 78 glycoside hydrolase catalytic domain [Flavobacterium sp. YJ01]|uniref:alpha-L-rhamnosidase n=1 Tax=Flavobacterium sp. YJ01 TaxID=3031997 RepID=UPI0023E3F1AB|nr:alpha-L-rhamnosidase [Flavobacterium sp. YJ01]WET01800.1 family 78 glycoside hydrolase catalytic domain [Flavobacterium sp. YJ01]